jgi:hypothetical protein
MSLPEWAILLVDPSDLDALVGVEIPGACTDCDAYAVVRGRDADGIRHLAVHHDDTCPVLRGLLRRLQSRPTPTGGGARTKTEPLPRHPVSVAESLPEVGER